MTALVGLTSVAASSLPLEMFGHWLSIPEGMPLLELLVAACFGARDRQQPETFRNPGLGQHHRLGPDPKLIDAGSAVTWVVDSGCVTVAIR